MPYRWAWRCTVEVAETAGDGLMKSVDSRKRLSESATPPLFTVHGGQTEAELKGHSSTTCNDDGVVVCHVRQSAEL